MDLEPPSKSPLHGEESYGEVEARLAEEIHTAQDEGVSPEELAMQRRRNQAILDSFQSESAGLEAEAAASAGASSQF